MNAAQIGPADVALSGGLYHSGEALKMAKLTFLGLSPNATVKLFRWEQTPNGDKFIEHDMLKSATVTEDREFANKMTIVGVSQMAMEQGRGTFDESDCMATWEIKITGCVDCLG